MISCWLNILVGLQEWNSSVKHHFQLYYRSTTNDTQDKLWFSDKTIQGTSLKLSEENT